jgi:hypothetical protein
MEMLEALSDARLAELMDKQRGKMRAFRHDYWELAWESASRAVRRELPEAFFLKLAPDIANGQLGLEAIHGKDGSLLVDSQSMGEMSQRFWKIEEALISYGFFADYNDCNGMRSRASFFDLTKHVQIPSGRFEARFPQAEI